MTPFELFKEDVARGLWNDTTYHYNEWLIANGYLLTVELQDNNRMDIDYPSNIIPNIFDTI